MTRETMKTLRRTLVPAIFAFVCASCLCAFCQRPVAAQEIPQVSQESSPQQKRGKDVSPFAAEISEAARLYRAGRTDEAETAYRQLLEKAKAAGDNYGVAEAHLGSCSVEYRHGKYDAARSQCEEARSLFDSLRDPVDLARVQKYVGDIAWQVGDNKSARENFNFAIKALDAAGMLKEKAELLISLAAATDGYPERNKLDTQALEIARQMGDRRVQAQALQGLGQWLFVQGDAQGADQKFKEAEALLDPAEDEVVFARVLHQEGRVLRAHGKVDDAIEVYKRALKMTEETGDKQGSVAVLNAMGAAYGDQHKTREALEIFQRTLDVAQDMNLPPMTDMLRVNIAEAHINLGEFQQAIDILGEINGPNPNPYPFAREYRYEILAEAYEKLGKYDLALLAVTKAVEEAKKHNNEQLLALPLMLRARVEEKLGQNEVALADVQETLKVIEDLRAHLVPSDFMKRGFVNRNEQAFAYSVQILHNLNKPQQALEVAEQARSRAFLDLLAARGIEDHTAVKSQETASINTGSNAGSANAATSNSAVAGLPTRGEPRHPPALKADPAKNLASPASVAPPSSDQMAAIAKRLDSTVLSYWVTSDATYIWTLQPDGTVREARMDVSQERLTKLISATMAQDEEPPADKASPSIQASAPPSKTLPKQGAVRLRGGGELVMANSSKDAWRDLYKLLILPVRDSLPPSGGRLTIVPYGPLFRLSFGALTDDRGRYLVEDYALNYTPALGLLQFTGAHKAEIENRTPQYLLFADPQLSPGLLKDLPLPPLPNARLEAQSVARLFPAASVSVLVASAATKEAVETQAPGKSVLHFATHAIVRDDDPFASFLALTGNAAKGDDGRLTVQDIYGLSMPADLVVLSACRTALGKVSGDGIVGLTRAFFYAGAISVVATLWDVADEPTYLLISDFYRNLEKGQDKATALRSAQLHVLRELRAGQLKVKTAAGPLTLPEDPVFWAGFVLQGEP